MVVLLYCYIVKNADVGSRCYRVLGIAMTKLRTISSITNYELTDFLKPSFRNFLKLGFRGN